MAMPASQSFHPATPSHGEKHPLVLVGGGGHALVVADTAALCGYEVVGFLDDNPDAVVGRSPNPVLRIGGFAELGRIADRGWILALGHLERRAGLIQQLTEMELGRGACTVVHPSAVVSSSASVGRGVFIGPRAVVNARARVLDHAIVNTGSIIEHECVVGFNAHAAPGTVLAGRSTLGENSLLGVGARVLPSLSIGDDCTVGGGAMVVRSVIDGQTVVGVPARERVMH